MQKRRKFVNWLDGLRLLFFLSNCLDEITASSYWLNGDILSFVLESYGKIVFRELY